MDYNKWTWSVRCLYGSQATPPKQLARVAVEVNVDSDSARDEEIRAGKERHEIGKIEMKNLAVEGSEWQTVYLEANPLPLDSV